MRTNVLHGVGRARVALKRWRRVALQVRRTSTMLFFAEGQCRRLGVFFVTRATTVGCVLLFSRCFDQSNIEGTSTRLLPAVAVVTIRQIPSMRRTPARSNHPLETRRCHRVGGARCFSRNTASKSCPCFVVLDMTIYDRSVLCLSDP